MFVIVIKIVFKYFSVHTTRESFAVLFVWLLVSFVIEVD